MGQYTFEEIKKIIFEWVQKDILRYMTQKNEVELTKNDKNILLFDFTFANCLAQLTVSKPFFAPYQFVAFEAMTLDSQKAQDTGEPELVYFFYDSGEMTAQTVINELEWGIHYCSCYIPNKLRKKYFNKRGIIDVGCENSYYKMHPDDIRKVNTESIKGEFVCCDVEAQYLVVRRDGILLRISPQIFIMIE